MNKIRDILLSHYIGAITIGLLLAQAIIGFVNGIVQAVATYVAIQQARGVFEEARRFSWTNFVASMVTACLYLLVSFALIRWLYSEPEEKYAGIEEDAEDNGGGQ